MPGKMKRNNLSQVFWVLLSLCLLPGYAPVSAEHAPGLSIELSGWYNDGWEADSHRSYLQHHALFSEVNPNWYNLGSDDTGPQAAATDGSIFERSYLIQAQTLAQIHKNKTRLLPTLSDHNPTGNKKGVINKILSNPRARQTLIANLVTTAQRRHYDGWDLNFEGGLPQGRQAFVAFVRDLGQALQKHHLRLSLTLQVVENNAQEQEKIFDYRALGQLPEIDRFKLMMYDHQFENGVDTPGPIAPVDWIQNSLSYLIQTKKLPANKIQLALHNHGWSWCRDSAGQWKQSPADFVSWQTLNPQIKHWGWDNQAQESWGNYQSAQEKQCVAYLGEAKTFAKRLAFVESYHLAGVAIWVLGKEDPDIYTALQKRWASAHSAK
jgi:spore germination protein YaaH